MNYLYFDEIKATLKVIESLEHIKDNNVNLNNFKASDAGLHGAKMTALYFRGIVEIIGHEEVDHYALKTPTIDAAIDRLTNDLAVLVIKTINDLEPDDDDGVAEFSISEKALLKLACAKLPNGEDISRLI